VSDDRPRRRRLPFAEQLEGVYSTADRMLDRGQHGGFRLFWLFLPETSIARNLRLQHVLVSRFLSDAGQQGLAYGALIAVARGGGSAFELALVGVAVVVPAALLGLYGGAVADALPQRVALAMAYNLQAALCFIVPVAFGTELAPLLALIFAVNALGQVSGPTESAVVPLVASNEELAAAASLVNLASSAGTALGTAVLAPIIVRVAGVEPVMFTAGGLLLLAATRVFDLPVGRTSSRLRWRRPRLGVRGAVVWLARQPAVTTMIVVGVVSGTANFVIQTLAPSYVVEALHVDPANAVYVFALSAAGLVIALAIAPWLMRLRGERIAALGGFVLTAVSLLFLGFVDQITPPLDRVNPLHASGLLGIELGAELRTAALLALPLGFGVALTTTSVQTYVNRRVPLSYQGRAFALQNTLKNGIAIVPLLSLGGAAAAFGVEPVLVAAPLVLLVVAYLLVQLSFLFAGRAPARNLEVFASFWEEADGEARPGARDEQRAGT
jgi:MFS family permease